MGFKMSQEFPTASLVSSVCVRACAMCVKLQESGINSNFQGHKQS